MEQPGRRESRGDEGEGGERRRIRVGRRLRGIRRVSSRSADFRLIVGAAIGRTVAFAGPERGPGRRTHYAATHPPNRAREWVSYVANRGMCVVLDPASEPCHELPGAGERGYVGSSAWGRRPLPGLLCCVNRVEVIPS